MNRRAKWYSNRAQVPVSSMPFFMFLGRHPVSAFAQLMNHCKVTHGTKRPDPGCQGCKELSSKLGNKS